MIFLDAWHKHDHDEIVRRRWWAKRWLKGLQEGRFRDMSIPRLLQDTRSDTQKALYDFLKSEGLK